MSEARVRVSLMDGVLEFEGPESVVAGLVEKFSTVIQTALAHGNAAVAKESTRPGPANTSRHREISPADSR